MTRIGVKRSHPRVFLNLVLLAAMWRWPANAQTAPAPQAAQPGQPPATATAQPAPRPATAPAAPATAQPAPQPAPQIKIQTPGGKKAEEGYDTSDGQFSFRAIYWYNPTNPKMFTGKTAIFNTVANVDFGNKSKPTPDVEIAFPAGRYNTIRVSGFRTQGNGNSTAGGIPATDTYFVWSSQFNPGDPLVTSYNIENVKVSLDYTSWPFPLNNAKFRIKTLWGVQYTNVKSSINAPLSPTEDASGNAIQTAGSGSNWFIFPSLGMGIEYMVAKHFRFEAKGEGFALPSRSNLWDAEASFAYRAGSIEIDFGAKAFHFRTSPQRDEYMQATMPGAYAGIRWYPK